jgi:hypothetical protein
LTNQIKEANEARKEWEKKLRDMIPSWPDLKEVLPWGGLVGNLDVQTTALGSVPPAQSSTSDGGGQVALLMGPHTWSSTVKLQGSFSMTYAAGTVTADVSGALLLTGQTTSTGRQAEVYAGTVIIETSDGDLVTLTVEKDANVLQLDGSDNGHITFVVTREISDEAWNAVLPYFIRIHLPVHRNADDTLSIVMNNATLSQLTNRTKFAVTDFNHDGIRNAVDRVAFLAGHAAQQERADMDGDQNWDQDDIDAWDERFLRDTQ